MEGCEAHLTRLLGEARLPSTLRAAFERSVSIAVEQEAKLAQERAHRIAQGVGAFRLIHALPPELRAVPSAHVFRLIDRSAPSRAGDGHPADAAPSRSTLATRIRGAGQAGLLLVGLGTASGTALLPGCAEPTAPADAIVACDGTGVEPGEVCTRELLACRFAAWAETASFHPGATFTVVTGAGSFGATSVAYRAVVPASWSSRSARPAWIRAQLAELASITIPQDSSAGERSPNQSDLISLVSVATREAAARSAPVDLLVATDGWFVSLGFDTEKDGVPPTEGLVARLHASGMPWNLSAFSAVTLCGLHSRGVDGGRVVARDGAWRALFAEGHAPAPRLLPSCSGLYPPVAPALLEAGDAESAEESSR